MTDSGSHPPPSADSWEGILDALRRRFPGEKDSILFCIWKLQLSPELGLRDLRPEADLRGITLAPRSLHSARRLLGIETAGHSDAAAPTPAPRRSPPLPPPVDDDSIETQVIAAVRQIQDAAQGRADRMRKAIGEAIAILRAAIED